MERFSLKDAAERTSRSVTTLRRYIRSGRLQADKLPGRFGPEYFVTEAQLDAADCHPGVGRASATDANVSEASISAIATRPTAEHSFASASLDRVLRETVPITLFQE